MKKVTNSKRRFNRKDILSWTLIILGHYLAFAAYTGIFILAKYLTVGGNLWPNESGSAVWVSYTFALAPAFNAALHIVYDEIGSPWTRFTMWVHVFVQFILIPIMIFVFL